MTTEYNDWVTSRMKVLTPSGYVEASQLKVGDIVLSWDNEGNKLVENRIQALHYDDSGVYGDLFSEIASQTVEVSPDYPFFLPKEALYRPIREIEPDQRLLSLRVNETKDCSKALTRRGDFEKGGIGPVISVTLESTPSNIVVESFVVQSHVPRVQPEPPAQSEEGPQ